MTASRFDWRSVLAAFVDNHHSPGQEEDPFFLFSMSKPSGEGGWPLLEGFYELCGGGDFSVLEVLSPQEVLEQQERWRGLINDRSEVLAEGRHLVFAKEPDATPVVLDQATGEVRSYYWREAWSDPSEGWTDFRFQSPEALFEWLFCGEHQEDWGDALRIIRARLD